MVEADADLPLAAGCGSDVTRRGCAGPRDPVARCRGRTRPMPTSTCAGIFAITPTLGRRYPLGGDRSGPSTNALSVREAFSPARPRPREGEHAPLSFSRSSDVGGETGDDLLVSPYTIAARDFFRCFRAGSASKSWKQREKPIGGVLLEEQAHLRDVVGGRGGRDCDAGHRRAWVLRCELTEPAPAWRRCWAACRRSLGQQDPDPSPERASPVRQPAPSYLLRSVFIAPPQAMT
jgi:hypothetical protein